jgi:hypothetical protein
LSSRSNQEKGAVIEAAVEFPSGCCVLLTSLTYLDEAYLMRAYDLSLAKPSQKLGIFCTLLHTGKKILPEPELKKFITKSRE